MSLEKEIKRLVKDRSQSRKLWARCPEDLQIAAFVDGTADGATRQHLQQHFSDCTRCLDQVSFLVCASEWPDPENAPPWLITKAEKLIDSRPKKSLRFDWRWATATVAVSFAVIFFILFAVRSRTPNSSPDRAGVSAPEPNSSVAIPVAASPKQQTPNLVAQSSPAVRLPAQKREQEVPITRKSEIANNLPSLLSPHDGSTTKRAALVFRWQNVPDVTSYEVSVMNASGDVIISRQTEAESLNLSGDSLLQTGNKYFVSVRAHLRDGRTIRSNVVSFRVID